MSIGRALTNIGLGIAGFLFSMVMGAITAFLIIAYPWSFRLISILIILVIALPASKIKRLWLRILIIIGALIGTIGASVLIYLFVLLIAIT
ncbi:hypothetical protein [Staphylothermus hellenicus]|uniref:Major facilitator superfamily (MFS) profile domain-containing protein n=1 Tax=Staphylothermus hellenicus (strain DSM 12710 / JCM 10830 / BK20S6-10-b1 / P8) TaxID=591019 RepID=D7DAX9_STAHD|nr:hypothetical protein [Staphylothermus hellenicus]ADI31326.1 hypothetical protein Shell_0183 [Staphylothermus hellenicus DSM 12710]